MTEKTLQSEMAIIIAHIDAILAVLNQYKANRAGTHVLTKLEEAGMWAQNALAHAFAEAAQEAEEKKEEKPIIVEK